MTWFKGDDKSHQNAKLLSVGLAGTGLHWRAVSWCASEGTNGRVPSFAIPALSPTLSPKARAAMVARMTGAALWIAEEDAAGDVVAYWINDFLEYNPPNERARQRQERRHADYVRAGKARAAAAERDSRGHFRPASVQRPSSVPNVAGPATDETLDA